MPNRRIKLRYLIYSGNDELKRPMRPCIPVADVRAIRAFHPFCYPPFLDAFSAHERVAAERQPPRDRLSNVGTQDAPVNAHDSIAMRGNGGAPERRPEERRRRHEPANHLRPRRLE